MKTGRRHESLIPLSREHQYGLLVCLRLHRGMENHRADLDWLSERAEKVIRFFESDLRMHLEAEEEIVFRAMRGIEGAGATIAELVDEHRNLARLVDRLRQHEDLRLAPLLREFADLLKSHIRKEERVLFPCYERNISPREAGHVKRRVLEVIGSAMKPKHPVLLE
ncbi:MAG: hemerythrin domain-containing protein [Acidobacteria bacterium]|nr:hemerythrin domain-containing protein [Acidobacteriota bacterium]MCI0719354.1 hemerythrin domain-containing protein [Acidobacteriota bacterium]